MSDDSELEDFNKIVVDTGYDLNDFKVEFYNKTNGSSDGSIILLDEETTVTRISTNKSKKYYSGHISHWVCDFENDLLSKKFD